jgi:hypothetical protein
MYQTYAILHTHPSELLPIYHLVIPLHRRTTIRILFVV